MTDTLKLYLWPDFAGEDKGDGGIRRVVEAQRRGLPAQGITLVGTPEEADVLAAHIAAPPPWYNLYPDKPIVAHCHGLYWEKYQWDDWALKANADVMRLLRRADAITSPSEWVSDTLRRHVSRPIHTVYHGVDMDEWKPDRETSREDVPNYVVWNKTRPDPVCDPEPMNLIAQAMPEVKFVSTFGAATENVKIVGRMPYEEGKGLVQLAHVYLATSQETFGIGTIEAMACGVPVVGYNWGGQREIIRDDVDGYLVPPGEPFLAADAIRRAFQNRERLSKAAMKRAAEFSWERANKQYADIYRAAYKKRQHSGPRTSVIVTNYNLEGYLSHALQSVRDQTDEDWECIVVDDASTNDEGRAIARIYAKQDSRFRLIANKTNEYLAEARNIGIREAKGRYIKPLDADDMLAPDALRLEAGALDADHSIHVAYGGVHFMNEDGSPTIYERFEETPGQSSWPQPFRFEQQIIQRNQLPYSSMYRREVWKNTGGYRPRCQTAEDADFWTRVSSYGYRPSKVTDVPTLLYRNRAGSMSRSEKPVEWNKWFPWSRKRELCPAGAVTAEQQPVADFDRPTVAVVIPCGPKHHKLVKDAIDSVEAQTFKQWECIVVFDGVSHNEIPELPSWVRVFLTSVHGDSAPAGVAAARNLGIKNAKAPLYLPLDADDYLQPDALRHLTQAFVETRDIVYSDFYEDPVKANLFQIYQLPDWDPMKLKRGTIHAVTALTPVRVWEQVGGYDVTKPAWEDWDFQLRCADHGFCSRRVAMPLFTYRKHTGERRNANVRDFETSKNGILSSWRELWEGSKELMACRSCGGGVRAPWNPPTAASALTPVGAKMSDGVMMVQYVGPRKGGVQFKGKGSGVYYSFAAGEPPVMVLKSDIEMFMGREEFKVTDPSLTGVAGEPPLVTR